MVDIWLVITMVMRPYNSFTQMHLHTLIHQENIPSHIQERKKKTISANLAQF